MLRADSGQLARGPRYANPPRAAPASLQRPTEGCAVSGFRSVLFLLPSVFILSMTSGSINASLALTSVTACMSVEIGMMPLVSKPRKCLSLLLLLPNYAGDTDFIGVSSSSHVEELPGTLLRPKQNQYFMERRESRCWPATYDVCLVCLPDATWCRGLRTGAANHITLRLKGLF